jgi:hypothetical protein
MNNLIDILKKEGVESACREIGINFEEIFSNNLSYNPYREHTWFVNDHSKVIVFNAVPPEDKQGMLFWEEWYRMRNEKKFYHHILTLWRPGNYDEIYVAPENDDIHPETTFGKKWYVVDDTDMTPLLLRR